MADSFTAARLVLDTNVLVSACYKTEGNEARVVELARAGNLIVCASEPVCAEYASVLMRPKFAAIRARARELTTWITFSALMVDPVSRVAAASDDDDNRFLECAEAARADYLITGNLRHFPAEWATARIVNARRFLELTISPPKLQGKSKILAKINL